MRRWQSTPVPQRFTDPSLKTPWTLESMIDAFRNGDDLLGCERLSECVGDSRLTRMADRTAAPTACGAWLSRSGTGSLPSQTPDPEPR